MEPIKIDILKQITDVLDWLIMFPTKLVDMTLEPQERWLDRKERIAKLKELVELREITKSVSSLFFTKGSIIGWVKSIQAEKKQDDIGQLRGMMLSAADSMENIAATIADTSFSGIGITAEATSKLGLAVVLLRKLAEAPDQFFLEDPTALKIIEDFEKMMDGAYELLKKVDQYRQTLDMSYD